MNRNENIDRLKSEHFDLIIIGGGITGAGIALDAASRGLKVALVEKYDFAFGTSSRSTKLIHGGLRYLKQLEFGLVKEVGSERAVVHRLAPHLVIPEKMLLPLYEKRGLGSFLTSFGLKLYDWLAGVKPEDQRKMLTRNQTLKQEPLLKTEDVKGGAIYAEYRTDDARLTIEIMKTACRYGAVVANYIEVTDFLYQQGKIVGVKIQDRQAHNHFEIRGQVVVNASGPWVDKLREKDRSKTGKSLHLTKGIHIVVPYEKFPVRQAIYFDVAEDGRMIFAIPRDHTTYIGTTDTNYSGNLDQVYASAEDVDYLLRAVNQTFQNVALKRSDVESSWAGLRPLIHEDGKSASELSRKDEIFVSTSGLISIAGGKLTGYRKMAERVVDKVVEDYFDDRSIKPCFTNRISLGADSFTSHEDVQRYVAQLSLSLRPFGMESYAHYLVATYGKACESILTLLENESAPGLDALGNAELVYCLRNEMVIRLEDFLVRRSGWLYFHMERLQASLESLLLTFQKHTKCSSAELEIIRTQIRTNIHLVTAF